VRSAAAGISARTRCGKMLSGVNSEGRFLSASS